MVESTISVQALGVGIAAFIATLTAAFLFINAWNERLARAFGLAMIATAVWGWIGFAAMVAADHQYMELGRLLRILSLIGNVLLCILFVRFALIYKEGLVPILKRDRVVYDIFWLGAAAIALLLVLDLFGAKTIVGNYYLGAVTPERGAVYDTFLIYYVACIAAIYFFMRSRLVLETGSARRGHTILVYGLTIGASAGAAGFLIWYGIHWPIVSAIRALAVPLLALAAFYAMSSHNIFNFRVAAANVFVFAIWSFLFFRILLAPSLSDTLPDILLLVALVVLGVLLIRSFNTELDTRLRVERAERERAIEQSKFEFVSIAAHQLRTPLSGIRWTFSVLESAMGLTDEQRELLKRGGERTKDVIDRVNEMLSAARLTDGGFVVKLTEQDIRPILKESVAMFEYAAQVRKLHLESSIPKKALRSRVDRDKLSMAVQNLIDNAIKYTKTGTVSLVATQVDDRIEIQISDTGIGIAENDTKHIFEKFYRHEKAVKMFTDGSGLGLFIVKKIMDAHGGTITVHSEDGKGTLMTLSIPAVVDTQLPRVKNTAKHGGF